MPNPETLPNATAATAEWGVTDDDGRVTGCPGEQSVREYQAAPGGELVSRKTIVTHGWPDLDLLTVPEVAEILRTNDKHHIYGLIASGELEGLRRGAGCKWLVRRSSLRRYLDSITVGRPA